LVPPGAVPENANGDNLDGQDDLIYPNQAPLLTLCPNYGCPLGGLEFSFPAPPPLSGINGGSNIALFANNSAGGSGNYGSVETGQPANSVGGYDLTTANGTFTLSAVPEPSTVSLLVTMLAGLGGLAGVLRKKLT
jgi:hypothetical protein